MRVLVIDDEPKVRRGLSHLIENAGEEYRVVGVAGDGVTAFEMIKELKPDVIFLDIKMPNMDGIGLLDMLDREDINLITIIISGYAEFEYAQKALHYDVLDYLLKPIHPQKVGEVLENAKSQIIRQMEMKNQQQYVSKNIYELREKFLYDIIFETKFYLEEEIIEKSSELNIPSSEYRILVIKLFKDGWKEELSSNVPNYHIKDSISDAVKRYGEYNILFNGLDSFTIVLYPRESMDISKCVEQIETVLFRNFGEVEKVGSVGFGKMYNELIDMPNSYREALEMLKCKHRDGNFQKELECVDRSPTLKGNRELSPIVIESIKYIKKNYRSNIKLADMAAKVYVHPSYLSERFKKETGENISDFMTDYRIQRAKELLRELENKVYMVAENVGFKDQRYFSQVFKKKTGMTPVQYREKCFFEQIDEM